MTFVKKIHNEWYPQEHKGIKVGDVVDFPGSVEKLLQEGVVVLCEEDGTEISTYESTGMITDREKKEFEAWIEVKKQEKLKNSLEKEHDSLVAEAKKFKTDVSTVTDTTKEAKKKEFTRKMAEGRAKAKAAREAAKNA